MEKELLVFLLQKQMDGKLEESERAELAAFFNRRQGKETATTVLEEMLSQGNTAYNYSEKRFESLIAGILQADSIPDNLEIEDEPDGPVVSGKGLGKKIWWSLAAFLLVAAAVVYFLYYREGSRGVNRDTAVKSVSNDIAPGGDRATLTTSDGSTLALDSADTGQLTQQGNATVLKTASGELRYTASTEMADVVMFNTVTTPRGGQYLVILADGSKVKLNSSSSITFPVVFTGTSRSVTITGEAFFEIADNPKMPFKVKAYDMEVEARGTRFNINTYLDEPVMKTTLLNGTLRLSKNSANHVLQPSQQGLFDREGNFSIEKNADTDEVTAWNQGMFQFNNSDVQAIMRQLSRWYDVDIVYEPGSPVAQPVFGEIKRDVPLSDVLKLLEKSDVRCRIDGRKLVVMP